MQKKVSLVVSVLIFVLIFCGVISTVSAADITMGEALDNTNLVWYNVGAWDHWYPVSDPSAPDGRDYATARVFGYETSTLGTSVVGPGTLKFNWWKETSWGYSTYDVVGYDENGNVINLNWVNSNEIRIGSGKTYLNWVLSGSSLNTCSNAYLDQVQWIPDDKTPPKITSTYPKRYATGVSRTRNITIKFSEKILKSTNWSKITVKNKYGHAVSISKSISGNTLYIKTKYKRSSYSYYTVYIPKAALKDYAYNNLATGYTFKFKTGRY